MIQTKYAFLASIMNFFIFDNNEIPPDEQKISLKSAAISCLRVETGSYIIFDPVFEYSMFTNSLYRIFM